MRDGNMRTTCQKYESRLCRTSFTSFRKLLPNIYITAPVSSRDAPDTPQTVISNTRSLRICASFNVQVSELYNSTASTNVLYNLTFVLVQASFDHLKILVNPLATLAARPMRRLMPDVARSETFPWTWLYLSSFRSTDSLQYPFL